MAHTGRPAAGGAGDTAFPPAPPGSTVMYAKDLTGKDGGMAAAAMFTGASPHVTIHVRAPATPPAKPSKLEPPARASPKKYGISGHSPSAFIETKSYKKITQEVDYATVTHGPSGQLIIINIESSTPGNGCTSALKAFLAKQDRHCLFINTDVYVPATLLSPHFTRTGSSPFFSPTPKSSPGILSTAVIAVKNAATSATALLFRASPTTSSTGTPSLPNPLSLPPTATPTYSHSSKKSAFEMEYKDIYTWITGEAKPSKAFLSILEAIDPDIEKCSSSFSSHPISDFFKGDLFIVLNKVKLSEINSIADTKILNFIKMLANCHIDGCRRILFIVSNKQINWEVNLTNAAHHHFKFAPFKIAEIKALMENLGREHSRSTALVHFAEAAHKADLASKKVDEVHKSRKPKALRRLKARKNKAEKAKKFEETLAKNIFYKKLTETENFKAQLKELFDYTGGNPLRLISLIRTIYRKARGMSDYSDIVKICIEEQEAILDKPELSDLEDLEKRIYSDIVQFFRTLTAVDTIPQYIQIFRILAVLSLNIPADLLEVYCKENAIGHPMRDLGETRPNNTILFDLYINGLIKREEVTCKPPIHKYFIYQMSPHVQRVMQFCVATLKDSSSTSEGIFSYFEAFFSPTPETEFQNAVKPLVDAMIRQIENSATVKSNPYLFAAYENNMQAILHSKLVKLGVKPKGDLLDRLGNIYYESKLFNKALHYWRTLFKNTPADTKQLATVLNSKVNPALNLELATTTRRMGNIYFLFAQYEEAEKWYRISCSIINTGIYNEDSKIDHESDATFSTTGASLKNAAESHLRLAAIYFYYYENWDTAKLIFQAQIRQILTEGTSAISEDPNFFAYLYTKLAELYFRLGENTQAQYFGEYAVKEYLTNFKTLPGSNFHRALTTLSRIYCKQKDRFKKYKSGITLHYNSTFEDKDIPSEINKLFFCYDDDPPLIKCLFKNEKGHIERFEISLAFFDEVQLKQIKATLTDPTQKSSLSEENKDALLNALSQYYMDLANQCSRQGFEMASHFYGEIEDNILAIEIMRARAEYYYANEEYTAALRICSEIDISDEYNFEKAKTLRLKALIMLAQWHQTKDKERDSYKNDFTDDDLICIDAQLQEVLEKLNMTFPESRLKKEKGASEMHLELAETYYLLTTCAVAREDWDSAYAYLQKASLGYKNKSKYLNESDLTALCNKIVAYFTKLRDYYTNSPDAKKDPADAEKSIAICTEKINTLTTAIEDLIEFKVLSDSKGHGFDIDPSLVDAANTHLYSSKSVFGSRAIPQCLANLKEKVFNSPLKKANRNRDSQFLRGLFYDDEESEDCEDSDDGETSTDGDAPLSKLRGASDLAAASTYSLAYNVDTSRLLSPRGIHDLLYHKFPSSHHMIDVAGDGNCCFYAVIAAYLWPVCHKDRDLANFEARVKHLFGDGLSYPLICALRLHLQAGIKAGTMTMTINYGRDLSFSLKALVNERLRPKLEIHYSRLNESELAEAADHGFTSEPREDIDDPLRHIARPHELVGQPALYLIEKMLNVKIICFHNNEHAAPFYSSGSTATTTLSLFYAENHFQWFPPMAEVSTEAVSSWGGICASPSTERLDGGSMGITPRALTALAFLEVTERKKRTPPAGGAGAPTYSTPGSSS